MRDEYNFQNSVANPYKKAEREKITIQLNAEVIDYFKAESARTGVPYQNIINFYLIDCVNEGKKLAFSQMSLGFLWLESSLQMQRGKKYWHTASDTMVFATTS